jgi:hypothetical protein
MASSNPENHLPSINRFITTHDPSTKRAIFPNALPEESDVNHISGADFRLEYVTKGFPVDLNQDADLAIYRPYLESLQVLLLQAARFYDSST